MHCFVGKGLYCLEIWSDCIKVTECTRLPQFFRQFFSKTFFYRIRKSYRILLETYVLSHQTEWKNEGHFLNTLLNNFTILLPTFVCQLLVIAGSGLVGIVTTFVVQTGNLFALASPTFALLLALIIWIILEKFYLMQVNRISEECNSLRMIRLVRSNVSFLFLLCIRKRLQVTNVICRWFVRCWSDKTPRFW